MKNVNILGKTRAYSKNQFPVKYTYSSFGKKTARVSNNISSIGVASLSLHANKVTTQITEVVLNDNIVELQPSCFANCSYLTSVQNDNNLRIIGDYAFYNCSSLKNVNFLQDGAHELCMVGDCAFMRSGLENVNVYLKSSVSDTGYGVSCFAECTALTSVNLQGAPFLAGHMFDGCINLKTVTMANNHNYVYEYCFANCQSLTEITLPANLYMLSPHMFDGCSNLRTVKFENGSILKQIGDHVFANCPKLTSIVLPASIDSIEYIDAEFLAGSSIDEVTFNGLSDDVFAVETRTYKHIDYITGKIYNTGFNTIWKCINDNNIPAVLYLSRGRNEGCGRCENWYLNVEDKHKNEIENTPYLWFGGNYIKHSDEYAALHNTIDALGLKKPGIWIYVYLYWKKEDGTIVKWTSGSISPKADYWKKTLKPKMNNLFAGYNGLTQIKYIIDPTITTFGKGDGLSVTYISSTGNRWICANDAVTKSTDYRVDNYTVDNFKYGTWYGNIKELHEFAKANHIPLVAEWSSAGCDPCIDFRRRVWQNKEFQDKIRSKSCLFCRIEAESTEHFNNSGTQQHYISHIIGDPKKLIPQLVLYWLKPNGTEYKDIWVYDYRGDPANANYQTVLSKIDALTSTYISNTIYNPIQPNISINKKYQYYDNQSYDINGQFFICDFKKSIQSYSGTKLSIDITIHPTGVGNEPTDSNLDETYNVLDSIEVGQVVEIPKLTYQYYTTEDNASFVDQYGVIFKADEQYYVDNNAIYLVDGVWEYKNGNAVSNEELARKVLKTGIQYIYSFENYSRSYTNITDDYNRYQTGKMIECTDSTPASSLDDILDFGGQSPEKLIVIVEMPITGSSIETDLLEKKEFTKWMKDSDYLFIKVKSNSWNSNAPKSLIDLEEYVKFDDNEVGSGRPKILVFKHCVNCSVEQYGAIYCKKTIIYDQTKDVSYYTSLIDSYNKISE